MGTSVHDTDVVCLYLRVRELPAFRPFLDRLPADLRIRVSERAERSHASRHDIVIAGHRRGRRYPGIALAVTMIHEVAHIALPGVHHDEQFRRLCWHAYHQWFPDLRVQMPKHGERDGEQNLAYALDRRVISWLYHRQRMIEKAAATFAELALKARMGVKMITRSPHATTQAEPASKTCLMVFGKPGE